MSSTVAASVWHLVGVCWYILHDVVVDFIADISRVRDGPVHAVALTPMDDAAIMSTGVGDVMDFNLESLVCSRSL